MNSFLPALEDFAAIEVDSGNEYYQHVVKDYKKALEFFKQELESDYSNSLNSYEDTVFETESGQVEELIIENFNVFSKKDVACLCFIAKYKSCPRPYVRTTMYIEKIEDEWKVLHVHCSFEPER